MFLQCLLRRKHLNIFLLLSYEDFLHGWFGLWDHYFGFLKSRKYEEIGPPKVEDFCYITDNTFTKQDVVTMEADILLALQFELGSPTIKTFLRFESDETIWCLYLSFTCPHFDCFTPFYVGFVQTVHKGCTRRFQSKLKPDLPPLNCGICILNSVDC